MTRLLHRVKPFYREDVYGFLKRVARNNLLKGWQELLSEISQENSTTVKASIIPHLAHYCLNSVEELAQLSGIELSRSAGDRIWQINGEKITKSVFISARNPKICPLCLKSEAYIHGSWSLSLYISCAYHLCSLLTHCHNCHKPLKWARKEIEFCKCGADLRLAPIVNGSPNSIFLAKLIDHRFNDRIQLTSRSLPNREIERLANLSLDGLCKTFWFLGHCVAQLGSFGSGHGKKIPSHEEASQMIDNAISLMQSWPNQLGDHLDKLSNRKPSDSTDSLINRLFGPAHYYLQHEIVREELFYIRTAYEQHIRKIWKKFDSSVGNPPLFNRT
jgi:hypothetical protein